MTKPRYELFEGRVFVLGSPWNAAMFETKDKAREAAAQVGLKPGHYILKAIRRDFLNRPTAWEIEALGMTIEELRQGKR